MMRKSIYVRAERAGSLVTSMCTQRWGPSVGPLLQGPPDHHYFACLIAFRFMCQVYVSFSDLILKISVFCVTALHILTWRESGFIMWLDYIQTTWSSDRSTSLSASISSFEDPIAVWPKYIVVWDLSINVFWYVTEAVMVDNVLCGRCKT